MNLDEKALKKYGEAFEVEHEARKLIYKKEQYTDKRLENVVQKKRAVIDYTIPKFIEVYKQVQNIEISRTEQINQLMCSDKIHTLTSMNNPVLSKKKKFTDKELVCGTLRYGVSGMMVKDSERRLSAANNQMSRANVMYSHAESISDIYDAIVMQANHVADVIKKLNMLFVRSIQETKITLEKNGVDVKKYNEYDKGILATCLNLAIAMSEMIHVPVLEENGEISERAKGMIITGEQYIEEFNRIINN